MRKVGKKIVKAMLNYAFNNIVTHVPLRIFRLFFLRLFNRKIHQSCVILMHTRILDFWEITINKGVVINQYCLLDCRNYVIRIDHDTDIGPYTRIWTSGHKPNSEIHEMYGGNVNIGHHVWIASGVIILPNINVADGTVVAAGSVLHKNTEDRDIVAGNPAKFLKKRINKLEYHLNWDPILE